ncbi:GNAT family N-acetyltransferase [Duganella qianjiadongensis]|uniref:GNAT family N-acetyltransferase n=1 Tax=Duganella qianjiadongensis TaxID=2692176 RepID=A0ABW9VEF9_9BURK|nr:GNAT family N-acetyltransferase [Duganella qianjiadongensis]MYM37999.1 GNAT family N-acetyltransferase [Duganella qianjiadongensis]
MSLNLALIDRWLTGRSLARGLSLPLRHAGGLCVEVGDATELRRHIFLNAGAALQACAAQTHVPLVLLKAAVSPEQMRAALPGHWNIDNGAFLMYGPESVTAKLALPPDYRISLDAEYGGYIARVIHVSEGLAASGRIALHGRCAVFDQVVTEQTHRRLGLGRAVMLTLEAIAEKAGVTERLLVATQAGRPLYEHLGWRVLAPWSTAML